MSLRYIKIPIPKYKVEKKKKEEKSGKDTER